MARKSRPIAERFAGKYIVDAATGCWNWIGSIAPQGYGKIRGANVSLYAHRVSYEIHVGPIPSGLVIDHLCRNRACVNPAHLEPVQHAENMARGATAIRQECNNGHPFTDENTAWHHGYRRCKECHRIEENERYHAKRAAFRQMCGLQEVLNKRASRP